MSKFLLICIILSLAFSSPNALSAGGEYGVWKKNVPSYQMVRWFDHPVIMFAKFSTQDASGFLDRMQYFGNFLHSRLFLQVTYDISWRFKPGFQKYTLSCEVAALRMILTSLTQNFWSEEDIFAGIPISQNSLSGGIWGDPDKEFVGSYTGSQRKNTGYGIYAAPLSKFLDMYGVENTFSDIRGLQGYSPQSRIFDAITTIESGGFVMLWGDWCTTPWTDDGVFDKSKTQIFFPFVSLFPMRNPCERLDLDRTISWKTKDGKQVVGLSGEHTFLLLGYIGMKENPTYIIVWDTDTGKHIYPIDEWMRKWKKMEYRMMFISGKTSYRKKY